MRLKQLVLFLVVLCAGVANADIRVEYAHYQRLNKYHSWEFLGLIVMNVDKGPVFYQAVFSEYMYIRTDIDTSDWDADDFLDNDGDGKPDGLLDPDDPNHPDNKDTDGDGVSDKDEIANGTDPNTSGDNVPVGGGDFLPDKDRDGTPDKYDPQPDVPNDDYDRHEMVDSDGDGYTNGQESALGSSPFNPNSTPRNPDMDPPDPDPEEPPPDPDGDNDGAQDFEKSDEADYFNNKFNLIREELTTSRNVNKDWLTVLHDDAGDLKNALSAIEDSIREGNAGEGGSGDEDKDINVTVDNSDVVNALSGTSLSGSAGNSGYDANGEVSDGDGIQADSDAILNNVAPSEEQQDGIIAKIREKLNSFLTIQLPAIGKKTSLSIKIPAIGPIDFPALDFDLENYPIVEMVRTGELILLCILFAFSCLKTIRWAVS